MNKWMNGRMAFNEQIPQWVTNRINPFKWLNEYEYEYKYGCEYERHDGLPEHFLGWIHLMKVQQQQQQLQWNNKEKAEKKGKYNIK